MGAAAKSLARNSVRRSRTTDNIKFFFGGLDSSVRNTHKIVL